jgi:hypothetical protein
MTGCEEEATHHATLLPKATSAALVSTFPVIALMADRRVSIVL